MHKIDMLVGPMYNLLHISMYQVAAKKLLMLQQTHLMHHQSRHVQHPPCWECKPETAIKQHKKRARPLGL